MMFFLVGGCTVGGTMNFSGPGNFQDLAQARYECYASLQGHSVSGVANADTGVAAVSGGPTVSCGAFEACLASKGYVRDKNGHLDASSLRVSCR